MNDLSQNRREIDRDTQREREKPKSKAISSPLCTLNAYFMPVVIYLLFALKS